MTASTPPPGGLEPGSWQPPPAPPGWPGQWSPPQAGYGWGGGGPGQWSATAGSKPMYVPGRAFFAVIFLLVTCGIVGSSGNDFGFLGIVSVMAALTLGLLWLLCLAISAQDTRLAVPRRTQVRWAAPPVIFFVTLAFMLSGTTAVTRFELSRPALEQAVGHARAGDSFKPGWIGLMQIHGVRVTGETTIFDLSPWALDGGCHLAYSPGDNQDLETWFSDIRNVSDYGDGWWFGCAGESSD